MQSPDMAELSWVSPKGTPFPFLAFFPLPAEPVGLASRKTPG